MIIYLYYNIIYLNNMVIYFLLIYIFYLFIMLIVCVFNIYLSSYLDPGPSHSLEEPLSD